MKSVDPAALCFLSEQVGLGHMTSCDVQRFHIGVSQSLEFQCPLPRRAEAKL